MITFSFHHQDTGIFAAHRFSADESNKDALARAVAANTPAGYVPIEGKYDHLSQRVDLSGPEPRVVDYQPPQPSPDHEWNAVTKRWRLRPDVAERQARRKAALAQIAALEASQARPIREAALGVTGAIERLRAIDERIAKLRKEF